MLETYFTNQGKPVGMQAARRQAYHYVAGFYVAAGQELCPLRYSDAETRYVVIGLPSSGLHSNGFSLVRKICFERMGFTVASQIPELAETLGEELLKPTRLYPKVVAPLLRKFRIKGMVHVTGGGFYDNIPRALPDGTAVRVDLGTWAIPPIFELLKQWGNVSGFEMFRTFNMGIGMALIVPDGETGAVIEDLAARGEQAYRIGTVVPGNRNVVIEGIEAP
jgi:phosphoribosylformylglycinamidine cyclo-ligase